MSLFLVGVLGAEDRRTDKSRLVIMTLNAEFLWDGVDPEEGQVNFAWKGSQADAEDHMEEIAEIIIAHNPDIVNLCEVEGIDALKALNDKFLVGRGYKAYLDKGTDTSTARLDANPQPDDLGERVRGFRQSSASG